MRKGYTEPTNYFPKDVLKKYPPKGGSSSKSTKSDSKKGTTKKK